MSELPLNHHFEYPKVTELPVVKQTTEHDPFIEDLPQKLAKVIDLNRNVVPLEDYRDGNQAA